MSFSVQSEVGRLRQVIVHRPGLELSRLSPHNVRELLFDEVMWASRAKEEHDAFAEALRGKGVQVHHFGQLLSETLELSEGRAFVLDRVCTPEMLGPNLVNPVRKLFEDLDGPALAEYLIGGVLKADLHPARSYSLTWDVLRKDDFVLPPLPNHLFQRDTSCWIYQGVSVNTMAKPARQREALHNRAIYRYHPMFADGDFSRYDADDDAVHLPASIEGGDVHVLGHGAVMIGMGERTTSMAVEILAQALFRGGQVHTVIAVELPVARAMMHLDTVMTMVDRHTFVLYPYLDPQLRSWTVTDEGGEIEAGPQSQLVGQGRRGARHRRGGGADHRRGPQGGRTRAVGRREQLPGRRPRRDLRLRAQRGHQHHAAPARHRGGDRVRQRAGPGPRRAALHDLPDRAGPGLSAGGGGADRHARRRLSQTSEVSRLRVRAGPRGRG